jgi:hypothetical protein
MISREHQPMLFSVANYRGTFASLIICFSVMDAKAEVETRTGQRLGYSYIGFGSEQVDYREEDENLLDTGLGLQTAASTTQLFQRSGGYVAHNSGWGFYIQTEATIGNEASKETWKINGTTVQQNSFTLKRNELRILVSKQVSTSHAFLFGGSLQDLSFSRFDWVLTNQDEFQVAISEGSVSEDIFKLFAYAGYEIGEFYLEEKCGWNWQIQLLAGIPIYSQTLNTSYGADTINGGFDGYHFELTGSVGYHLSKNFLLGLSLKNAYEDQKEIEQKNQKSHGVIKRSLPENSLTIMQPSVTFYWSF